jgi:hypothetical protein
MDLGHAQALSDSTGAYAPASGSPVPVSGLRAIDPCAPSTPKPLAEERRSRLDTLPCAGLLAAPSEPREEPPAASIDELPPSERERQKLAWCVDFGDLMRTMSTFDLWTAIERGEVSSELRVWREGMECWTPIERVPSLAVALVGLAPLTTPTPSPATATTGPTPDVHSEPRVGRPVPAPLLASAPPPPRRDGRSRPRSLARTLLDPGTLWMALGSGVAAGAITAALMVTHRAAPAPQTNAPTAMVAAALPAPPRPAPALASEGEAQGAAREASLEVTPVEPRLGAGDVPRARHDELGQHRLRRGKKPARAR